MYEDDNPFSLKNIILLLIVAGVVYWLLKSPSKKDAKPHFVYEYVANTDSLQKGKRFVVTSLDTTYADKQDGTPNLIEVRLSPE